LRIECSVSCLSEGATPASATTTAAAATAVIAGDAAVHSRSKLTAGHAVNCIREVIRRASNCCDCSLACVRGLHTGLGNASSLRQIRRRIANAKHRPRQINLLTGKLISQIKLIKIICLQLVYINLCRHNGSKQTGRTQYRYNKINP